MVHGFTQDKDMKQHAVFNIDNTEMFLEQQISIDWSNEGKSWPNG